MKRHRPQSQATTAGRKTDHRGKIKIIIASLGKDLTGHGIRNFARTRPRSNPLTTNKAIDLSLLPISDTTKLTRLPHTVYSAY